MSVNIGKDKTKPVKKDQWEKARDVMVQSVEMNKDLSCSQIASDAHLSQSLFSPSMIFYAEYSITSFLRSMNVQLCV